MKILNKNPYNSINSLIGGKENIIGKRIKMDIGKKKGLNIFNKQITKSFSYKYIPIEKIKFEDIGFRETVSLIYSQDDKIKRNIDQKIKIKKAFFLTGILGISAVGINTYSLGIPLLISPFLYRQNAIEKKYLLSHVNKIYLCKNGHQLLMQTLDGYFQLIHIKDITNIHLYDIKKKKIIVDNDNDNNNINISNNNLNLNFDGYLFELIDKKFVINLSPSVAKIFNNEIFDSLNTRMSISTDASFSHYHRMYFPK